MNKQYELIKQSTFEYCNFWIDNVFLSFNWWVLVVLLFLPWVIWWKLVDKKQVWKILSHGLIISVIVVLLDDIGSDLGLWYYPYKLIPVSRRLNPIDLCVIPVFYMLIYQYALRWKQFLLILTIFSVVSAFVSEPIFTLLGIYSLVYWKYIYSLPLYFLLGVFCKWLTDRLNRKVDNL